MPNPSPKPSAPKSSLDDQKFAKLRAEVKSPFRGVRRFFYGAFAASALLGGFILFFKLLSGADLRATTLNLLVQGVVLGLMLGLLWWERDRTS